MGSSSLLFFFNFQEASHGRGGGGVAQHECEEANCETARRFSIIRY